MKRTRDDVYPGSQIKRPLTSSRGESFGQSHIPLCSGGGGGGGGAGFGGNGAGGGGGGSVSAGTGTDIASHKLTTNDALTYLKEVKDKFQDQRDKYEMFLEVMKDFKAQRTDTSGVIARVKELFKGHNNLIFGFNTFLPKGYEITLEEDETPPKKTVEFEEAINFVNKIKKRFQNDENEHVYKSFLDILNMYRKERKDINEVYSEVASLFENHQDLLDEFARFLPNTSVASLPRNAQYGGTSFQRLNEQNSTTLRKMQLDKDRVVSYAVRDRSVDRPELDDDKAMMKVHKEHGRRTEKENKDRRDRDQDDRESEHDSNRDLSYHRFPDKRKASRRVEAFGVDSNISSYDDKDNLKNMYNQGLMFCEKVKEKLGISDDYQAFLKCLNIYSNGIIKRNDLQNLIADLLGKYPELMKEFNDFFERCENIDDFLAGVMNKKSLVTEGHTSRSIKLEDRDKEQKRDLDAAKERERCREKYLAKSIQELDLSNSQSCTPSYRLLPDDYPISSASQRSELGAQVLNDHWVSVTSGSEDYSFKHMRRNQYEESLFRCEDDRFELDMLLESVACTSKRAEELLNTINENKIDIPFSIDDHFTALNLRFIERLYGDHGLDVMDILRKNPTLALPIILTRLKQKQEEWTKCRTDFNKVWAEIYVKNHFKSLDHRSFYFKQQDSKNLSTRSLVSEIKELKEKQQEDDDVLLGFAAGIRQPVVPHMHFDFFDMSIHEDLYKLVQYSCEELFPKEQSNKIMRLWTTFLEPMLGINSHVNATETSKLDNKSEPLSMKCSTSSITGSFAEPTLVNCKQLKSSANETENTSQEPASFCGPRVENGDSLVEHSLRESNSVCKNRTSSTLGSEREHIVTDVGVRTSRFDAQVATVLEVADAKSSHVVVAEQSHARASASGAAGIGSTFSIPSVDTLENHKLKGATDIGTASEVQVLPGGTGQKSVLPAQVVLMNSTKSILNHEDPTGPSRMEKEEGELSPNPDFEEDSSANYGDNAMQDITTVKNTVETRQIESGNLEDLYCQETGREIEVEVDADDEESDDASGSESAGDECSREEDGDVEHDDNTNEKAESEGEAEGMTDAQSGDMPSSERFLLSAKPLLRHVPPGSLDGERRQSWKFYGNDDFYVLFRLHQTLYERILSAKTNSTCAEMKSRSSKDACSLNPYARFMTALYNLLDGSADNAQFEDECRTIIGNQSYVLFTLDKLIYKLAKQLQTVVTDEMDAKLLQLYEYEKSHKSGKFIDSVYYDNARFLLHDENIYRLEFACTPSCLSIQLMDNITEKPEGLPVAVDPNFAAYLHNDFLSIVPSKKELRGISLQRNKRKFASLDEHSALSAAMEGVKTFNGLECKISCNSYKISYVLDTEDFFIRSKKKRRLSHVKSSNNDQVQARVQRFHRFLAHS